MKVINSGHLLPCLNDQTKLSEAVKFWPQTEDIGAKKFGWALIRMVRGKKLGWALIRIVELSTWYSELLL